MPFFTEFRLRAAAVGLLLLLTWFYVSFDLSQLTQPDQGTFMAFGYHLLQGKTLYTDFFDHKPPAIYLLNAAIMVIGGVSENAISWFALFCALLQTFVFFRLAEMLFRNLLSAFLIAGVFVLVFFRFELFGTGNFTEQYGALCTSAGLLFFLAFTENGKWQPLFLSGMLFGAAFAFKEPFLFSAVPYGLFLLFRKSELSKKLRETGLFALAFLTPWLLVLAWMLWSGTLPGYAAHIEHSLQYTKQGEPLWLKVTKYYRHFFSYTGFSATTGIWIYGTAFILSFFSCVKRSWLFLILGQQLVDYIGTGMTGNGWHHYFMQSMPLMLLVFMLGLDGISGLVSKAVKLALRFAFVAFAIFLLLVFFRTEPWKQLAFSPEKRRYDEIANYLQQYPKPVNLAVARQECGFYYVKLQAVSPLKYVVPYPFHWVIADSVEKARFLNEERLRLEKNPPEFILTGHEYAQLWIDAGMDKYAQAHYTRVSSQKLPDGTEVFLLRKERVSSPVNER